MTTAPDDAADLVARHIPPRVPPGAPCPDESTLAAFASDRLPASVGHATEVHLVGCAPCREAVGWALDAALVEIGVNGGAPEVEPAGSPRPKARVLAVPRRLAIAAAALVAIGVGALVIARSRSAESPPDTDVRLVAAASELASAEPVLFDGFVPLSRSERAFGPDGRERGGLRLLGPTEVVLSSRPAFRWMPVPGAQRYDVSLAHEGGGAIGTWTALGAEFLYPADLPDLEPGSRYAWKVAIDGVLGGRTESRRTFVVASRAETEAFARAQRAITDHVPLDIKTLLAAHWALRHGLLDEAERLAREHLGRDRDGAAGRETLQAILRRRGAPDDDATAPAPRPPR